MTRAHRPGPTDRGGRPRVGLRRGTRVGPCLAMAGIMGALGVLAGGCYEGFDPLDPEVLAEVARGRGDAVGQGFSGIYVGSFEALECGCTDVDARYQATLCMLIERAEELGLRDQLDVELVQADGTVRAQGLRYGPQLTAQMPLLPVLYGPVQADGHIAVAGVLQADSVLLRGQVLARFDGTLEGEGSAAVLEVEYQQRYVVDLFGDPVLEVFGEPSEVLQSVDCRERIALTLQWNGPPAETFPVDEPGG